METSGVSMMSRPNCRSPFFPDAADSAAAERHYRHSSPGYHHCEPLPPHSSIARQPRLYAEEMPFRPVCLCHSCNVARMESRSKAYTGYAPEAEWSATLQEQYYRRDYMATKSYADGHSSFSIHTPVRRDADMMHHLSSPPSVSRMPKCSPQSSGFAATPPFFPKYPFADNQINLCKWFPIRLPDAENPAAIALGGYRVSHTSDFVKTGTIVERMRKTALRTSDGVEVVLAGPLDMRMAIMNGFSDTVADAFYSGFPLAWKSILSDDAHLAKMRANITSLARPSIDRVPEVSPAARAEPEPTVPVGNDDREENARAADEVGAASPLSNDQVSHLSTPIAARPAAGEAGSAASGPQAPSSRTEASQPVAESGAQEVTVAAEPLDEDVAAASVSLGEEARPRPAEEGAPLAAEASHEAGHEPDGNDMAEGMEAIGAEVANMEVDGDPCPGVVDDPPGDVSDRPANARKRSRSRARARYGKRRKGRSKKPKISNKEAEQVEEPADKTEEHDQLEEQQAFVADKADEQDQSEESRQPASVADKPDEEHPESGDDELRQEQAPPVQHRKSIQRTKRSPLPPPLPTPRVTKDEVIEAYGLKTSRSGRLLVPPLAYWRNQTVARDKDGGIIAIFEGFEERPSDTGYFNFKPPTRKKAVKLQEKLCAAASESALTSKPAGKGRASRRRR